MVKEKSIRSGALRPVRTLNNEEGKERGKRHEQRALVLMEQLVDDGFFVRLRRASKRQNKRQNIDIIAVIQISTSLEEPYEIDIPFQIKSSNSKINAEISRDRVKRRSRYVNYILVNESQSDSRVKKDIRRKTRKFLSRKGIAI